MTGFRGTPKLQGEVFGMRWSGDAHPGHLAILLVACCTVDLDRICRGPRSMDNIG